MPTFTTTPTSPGSGASCIYLTQSEFTTRFGTKSVAVVSNKDSTSTDVNADAVQQAFDFAVEEVHNTLLGGLVAVPLDFSPWSDIVPQKVKYWVGTIAYSYLYFDRGLDEKNKTTNKYWTMLKEVYADMLLVKNGIHRINAAPAKSSLGETLSLGADTIEGSNSSLNSSQRKCPWYFSNEELVFI